MNLNTRAAERKRVVRVTKHKKKKKLHGRFKVQVLMWVYKKIEGKVQTYVL